MVKKISPLLEDIRSYLEQLFNALESEYTALSDNDIQAIQSIAKEKVILMEQLEDLNKERRILLEEAGLNLSSNGIDDFFNSKTLPKNPKLQKLWSSISSLTKQCEKQNNINGIIIENNKRHTKDALSILQGKQKSTELYTNKGQTINTSTKKILIRA